MKPIDSTFNNSAAQAPTQEEMEKAVHSGNITHIMALIQEGADPNCVRTESGDTILIYCCYYNQQECIAPLIEAGVEIDAQGEFGNTALIAAALNNRVEIVRMLIEADADISLENDDGCTALTYCGSSLELTKLLVEKGAAVDVENKEGITPLMAAAMNGHAETVRFLIGQGANIHKKDRAGNEAVSYVKGPDVRAVLEEVLAAERERDMRLLVAQRQEGLRQKKPAFTLKMDGKK